MMPKSLLAAIVVLVPWAAPADPAESIPGFEPGPAVDRVVPGELIADPPTLENLGFRWYVAGDGNRNASVKMAYREAGQAPARLLHPVIHQHRRVIGLGGIGAGDVAVGRLEIPHEAAAHLVREVGRPVGGGVEAERGLALRGCGTGCFHTPLTWCKGPSRLTGRQESIWRRSGTDRQRRKRRFRTGPTADRCPAGRCRGRRCGSPRR